jgi:3-isopropylmalate/(R)-2-methylmalate dehydratase small subunit
MEKFTKLTAIAAPLRILNVDTDMIIPKQFLKTVKRTGLGANLFDEMRFTSSGEEIVDFVLNKEPYKKAGILVSGENFGCGSSREHAPWSLLDFGIRCIIAPSFADIFYNNCFKNGILPVILDKEINNKIMDYAESANPILTVDLHKQIITSEDQTINVRFELEAFRKKCLIEGLDDIGLTLEKETHIIDFEDKNKKEQPWLYEGAA